MHRILLLLLLLLLLLPHTLSPPFSLSLHCNLSVTLTFFLISHLYAHCLNNFFTTTPAALTFAYISIELTQDFKEKVSESRKRPNAYFGYAVGIALDVDPDTADAFFKDLPYE